MKSETIDRLGTAGTNTITAGASLTGFGWLTSNEFFGLVGALVAVMGLAITWYYKREANRRHAREHELRMELLRRGRRPDTDLGELGADE
jgi:hypothetical protein